MISVLLKLLTVASGTVGVWTVLFSGGTFMGAGNKALMYFTIQSNILLAAAELTVLVCQLVKGKNRIPAFAGILQYWSVVSITLTFVVFCTMLAPFLPTAWNLSNTLTHAVAPVAAIVDYLFFDRLYRPGKKQAVLATVPALAYLGFTVVAWFRGWTFGGGLRYPYSFLNYGGSAGVFGFSTDLRDSLFLGSFYWVLILLAFVIGVAALYRRLHNGKQQ